MMTLPQRGSMLRRGVALAAALTILALAGAPALAQTMTNSFGGFSRNSGEPIDIESDVLVVHDAKKYATFKGNVKAVQGSTTLRARELDVHYVGSGGDTLTGGAGAGATQPAGVGMGQDSGTQISQIEARGSVIITSERDQTTTSDWALYDVPTQIVTVGGNVVLMQGKNMLKGDRLIIDLKTGESRFENQDQSVAGGRIRALFVPQEEGKKKGGEGEAADASDPGSESAAVDEADVAEDDEDGESKADKAARKAEKKAGGEFERDPTSLR